MVEIGEGVRPLLFLDVDGVLNCFNPDVPVDVINVGTAGHASVPRGTDARVGALLRCFEPIWATGWGATAHAALAAHLGLDPDPWPHLVYAKRKLPEILAAAGERPWAWVDDDAFAELGATGVTLPPAAIVMAPDPRRGLSDGEVAELARFAALPATRA